MNLLAQTPWYCFWNPSSGAIGGIIFIIVATLVVRLSWPILAKFFAWWDRFWE